MPDVTFKDWSGIRKAVLAVAKWLASGIWFVLVVLASYVLNSLPSGCGCLKVDVETAD